MTLILLVVSFSELSGRFQEDYILSNGDSVQLLAIDKCDSLLEVGEKEKALLSLKSIEKKAERADYRFYFIVLNKIADLYWIRGELSQALPYLLKAKEQAELNADSELELQSLDNLGTFYASYDRAEQSVELFRQMRTLSKSNGNESVLNIAEFKLGSMLLRLDSPDYDSSLYFLHKSRLIYESSKDSVMLSKIYGNISLNHEELNNLDSAGYWLDLSIRYELILGYYESLILSYHNLGLILYKMGSYEEAYENFLESKLGADTLKYSTNKRDRAKALFGMGASLNKMSRYEEAINLFHEYDTMSTAYYTTEFNELLSQKETEYGLLEEQRKNDMRSLQLERQRQRNTITLAILIFVLVFIAFWVYFSELKKRNLKAITLKNQQLANQKINDLLQQQEIHSLQGVLAGQETERKLLHRTCMISWVPSSVWSSCILVRWKSV